MLADETVDDGGAEDVLWPLTDWQGTVRDLATYDTSTDTTSIANHKVYDAYGNVYDETNSATDTLFGYTGRMWDDDTALQNNLNRWYDPATARWLSEDPIGFAAGDPNLYRYVGNSPAGAVDPSGLEDTYGPFTQRYPRSGSGSSVLPPTLSELRGEGRTVGYRDARAGMLSGRTDPSVIQAFNENQKEGSDAGSSATPLVIRAEMKSALEAYMDDATGSASTDEQLRVHRWKFYVWLYTGDGCASDDAFKAACEAAGKSYAENFARDLIRAGACADQVTPLFDVTDTVLTGIEEGKPVVEVSIEVVIALAPGQNPRTCTKVVEEGKDVVRAAEKVQNKAEVLVDAARSKVPKKTRWQYITEWHDKRATELFGKGKGRSIGKRDYDKTYKGKDIEFKSDNFSKGPRKQDELDRMTTQIEKDIKNKKAGTANPHWHFDHDPTQAAEMAPLIKKLKEGGIPWTWGKTTPF